MDLSLPEPRNCATDVPVMNPDLMPAFRLLDPLLQSCLGLCYSARELTLEARSSLNVLPHLLVRDSWSSCPDLRPPAGEPTSWLYDDFEIILAATHSFYRATELAVRTVILLASDIITGCSAGKQVPDAVPLVGEAVRNLQHPRRLLDEVSRLYLPVLEKIEALPVPSVIEDFRSEVDETFGELLAVSPDDFQELVNSISANLDVVLAEPVAPAPAASSSSPAPAPCCSVASGPDSQVSTSDAATSMDHLGPTLQCEDITTDLQRIKKLVQDSELGLQAILACTAALADTVDASLGPSAPAKPTNSTPWRSADSGVYASAGLSPGSPESGPLSSTFRVDRPRKRVSFGTTLSSTPAAPRRSSSSSSDGSEGRLILFGLPDSAFASSICRALGAAPSCPDGYIEVVKFFVGRDGSRNCIVAADRLVCAFFEDLARITIDFQRVKIRRFVFIGRCYNCHEYDHVSRRCSRPLACGNCGGSHSSDACSASPSCAHCVSARDHRTDSRSCPTFLQYKRSKLEACIDASSRSRSSSRSHATWDPRHSLSAPNSVPLGDPSVNLPTMPKSSILRTGPSLSRPSGSLHDDHSDDPSSEDSGAQSYSETW